MNDSAITPELDWTLKSGSEDRVRDAIKWCERTRGSTTLWDAVDHALGQSGSANSAYWIVVLGDGDDNTSKKTEPVALNAKIEARLPPQLAV